MTLSQLAKALSDRGATMRVQRDGDEEFVVHLVDAYFPSTLAMGIDSSLETAIEEALKEWDEIPDADDPDADNGAAEEEETQ
jgi:hypothetical protein